MNQDEFFENVRQLKNDFFALDKYIKEISKEYDIPVSELRNLAKKANSKRNSNDLDVEVFIEHLIEEAKKGKVAGVNIFYDLVAGKYLFEKNEKLRITENRYENYKKITFIDAVSLRRIIQEYAKQEISVILSGKEVNRVVEWIPSYFKNYSPHHPSIYKNADTTIYTKNMCVLPDHLVDLRELDKNNKIAKRSYTDVLKSIKDELPNTYLLLKNLFVQDGYIEYFLNWMAYIVQYLEKTRNAIVLVGEQGTGKGVLWENIITWIFNRDNCVVVSNADIRSNFNVVFENRLFVCFNEIKGDFSDRSIIYESMKGYIADEYFTVNMKNVNQYEVRNYFNTIVFSNHEIPLQVEKSDRRYSVFKTNHTKLKDLVNNTAEFVEKIRQERELFLNFLFEIKVDEIYAHSLIETEQKRKIKELSNTKQDIIKSEIVNHNVKYFEDKIEELIEGKEDDKLIKHIKNTNEGRQAVFFEKTNNEMMKEFLKNCATGVFSMEVLKWAYKILINENETDSKITKFWNYIFDDGDRIRINGNKITIKYIKSATKAIIWGNLLVLDENNKWVKAGDAVEVVIEDKNGNLQKVDVEEIPF